MGQLGEELQETLAEFDGRATVGYLIENPEFFIRNAHAIGTIRVSHPIRGTVSLVEWHIAHIRNHIHVLEENMALLTGQAVTNEGLFHHLLYLQHSLTAVSNLDDILMRFYHWACDLGLAGASLRLSPDRWCLGAPSNHTRLTLSRQSFEPLRIQRLGQERHYLGPLNESELLVVLPEVKTAGSVMMSMLGSDTDLGVALFTNHDTGHYQQGQGTQLPHKIVLILPKLLERWIECVWPIYIPTQNATYVI